MNWLSPGEEAAVRVVIKQKDEAKNHAERLSKEKHTKACTWWTDGSRSDDGRVGAAAVCNHSERGGWRALRSYLQKGRMEVFDAEMWVIWITLKEIAKRAERLRAQGVQKTIIFSNSQAAVPRAAHLETGPRQQTRWINNEARALGNHGIETEIR